MKRSPQLGLVLADGQSIAPGEHGEAIRAWWQAWCKAWKDIGRAAQKSADRLADKRWRDWLNAWKSIGRAVCRRAELIERHGLPSDAPAAIGREVTWNVLGAPDEWEPDRDIPPTRAHCADVPRPCRHIRCPHNLLTTWPAERPGRPHGQRRRIPGLVVYREDTASCALDVVDASPDGVTADDAGAQMAVVGRRTEQVERKATLKMEGVRVVRDALEAIEFRPGISLALVMPHNERHLPDHHFITVAIEVDHKVAQPAGVTVRRRRGGK